MNIAAAATIIFLRPSLSQRTPAESDEIMPPNMTAPTIQLTCASVNMPIDLMYGIAAAIAPKSIPYRSPPRPAIVRRNFIVNSIPKKQPRQFCRGCFFSSDVRTPFGQSLYLPSASVTSART